MKLPSTISGLVNKMDSKLGSNHHHSSLNDPETRSTISSSELLPAYSPRVMETTALQVAKIISRTLLLITLIVSLLVLVTVYIQAKTAARCDYGISAKESRNGAYFEPLTSESDPGSDSGFPGSSSSGSGRKIPISIRMSGKAGDLMSAAPNGKGHVNCVIERKTANQIIASEPKKLFTPYGNITTDPRLIHLTGEKLVFSCHSGDKDDKDEKEKDVIIITNNKEVMDPTSKDRDIDDPRENMIETGKESEAETSGISGGRPIIGGISGKLLMKSRDKRSAEAKKEMLCNCAC